MYMSDDDITQALSDVTPDDTTEATTDDTSVEETTEETQASEVTEEAEQSTDETEGEETDAKADEETTEEIDPVVMQKQAAHQAYLERQQARQQREAQITQAQQEDLTQAQEQGADDEQIAIKQLQWANYQNTVTNNTDKLQNQLDAAANEIPLYKSDNPAIQRMLADAEDEFMAKHIQVDQLGNVIGVSGNLKDFLQTKASLIEQIAKVGEVTGKSNAAKQRMAVTPKPSGSPRQEKVDPILSVLQED